MQERPRFELRIQGPLSDGGMLPALPLGPNVALSFGSELNGGWSTATIGILDEPLASLEERRRAYLPIPVNVRPFSHVEIRVGNAVVWEGRAVGDQIIDGEVRGINAAGYGISYLQDDWYSGGSATDAERTSGRIIREIFERHASLISIGEFTDPGTLHLSSEFARMTPMQALEMVAKEGGGDDGNEWMWTVYHRTLQFVERTATTALYAPPIDKLMPIDREFDMWSHGSMFYRIAGLTRDVDLLTSTYFNRSLTDQGITRHKMLEGGASTSGGAAQYVRSFLQRSAEPLVNITIDRDNWNGLETADGGIRSPWLVRAGEWVQVRPLGLLPIIRTEFDARTGKAAYALGRPLKRNWSGIIRRVLEADTNVRSALDIETGKRWGR